MTIHALVRELLGPGWSVFRRFWLAFTLIQSLAIFLVFAYYNFPLVAIWCNSLASLKAQAGLLFIICLNPIAAGVVPEIFRHLTRRGDRWNRAYAWEFTYLLGVFASTGVLVDLFYRAQSLVLGDQPSLSTVAMKVLIDQLLFSPLLAQPLGVSLLFLYRVQFNVVRLFQAWSSSFYRHAVLPLIVPGWLFWFPMTACIYSLPSNLQVPLFLFGMAAWSLIFVALARQKTAPHVLIKE
ncbi:MAG: hypothetical protein OHK005_14100 [Candidatus Methylacidiphilales bacterium]